MKEEKPSYLEWYKAPCSDGVERTYVRASRYFKNRMNQWKSNERAKGNQKSAETIKVPPVVSRPSNEAPAKNDEENEDFIPF